MKLYIRSEKPERIYKLWVVSEIPDDRKSDISELNIIFQKILSK